jgi:mitosis inhibitor protein kinase SWE1
MGVIHFDLKPANILITATGGLKIGDFGLASRWPRISPTAVLAGSGLGGDVGSGNAEVTKMTDREGDRVYMPPEMLRGHYSMAADIFSYGLMILEVATNICVPDGGGECWLESMCRAGSHC